MKKLLLLVALIVSSSAFAMPHGNPRLFTVLTMAVNQCLLMVKAIVVYLAEKCAMNGPFKKVNVHHHSQNRISGSNTV